MQQVGGAKVNESWIWQDGCRNNLTTDNVWERAFSFLSHCNLYYLNFRFLITFLSLSSYFRQIFFIYQMSDFFITNLTSDKVVAETLEHLTRCGRGHFLCYHIALAITFTFHLNCFQSHFLITLQSFSLSNCKRFLITLNNGEKKLRCGSSLEQTNICQRMPFIVIYFFPPLCRTPKIFPF